MVLEGGVVAGGCGLAVAEGGEAHSVAVIVGSYLRRKVHRNRCSEGFV